MCYENININFSDIINYINKKSLIKFNSNDFKEFSVRDRFHKYKLYTATLSDEILKGIDIATIIKQINISDDIKNNDIDPAKLVANKTILKAKFFNIIEKYKEHLIFLKYGSKNKLKKFVSKITQSLPDKFETILNDDN